MEDHSDPLPHSVLLVKLAHYTVPSVATLYFFIASLIGGVIYKTRSNKTPRQLRIIFGILIFAISLTYVVDSVTLIVTKFGEGQALPSRDSVLYALASALSWSTSLLWYFDNSGHVVTYAYCGYWLIYGASELSILSLSATTFHFHEDVLCRIFRLLFLSLLLGVTLGRRILQNKKATFDEENDPLLDPERHTSENTDGVHSLSNGAGYGSVNSNSNAPPNSRPKTPKSLNGKPTSTKNANGDDETGIGGFWASTKDLKLLVPFFWPAKRLDLQLLYLGVTICLAIERIMNIVIPLQIGLITNILSNPNGVLPWRQILIFVSLRLLDSSGGLPTIRRFMWMPLEDYSYQKLSTTAFDHIMSLSCDFHDSKHSGKLWQTVFRGQSIKDVVNSIFFHVGPMVVDLGLAVSVLYYLFDAYMALNVAAVAVIFIWSSGKLVARQRDKRREWIESRTQEFTALCESTGNWRTVSYFNRVTYEQLRYMSLVKEQLKSRRVARLFDHMENATQSFLLIIGLTIACLMATYHVVRGERPIGSFIMLLSYWAQLSGPLQFIANGFGDIARDLVDVEEFLELLREKPSITDCDDVKPLVLDHGNVEFSGVNFSYNGKKEVLRNINFLAQSGRTTALVGQTGGGKSTILKLIFRFYDPLQGTIKIDGQDISCVTINSLRESIGVVPQDPTLFNDTILNNIRYAKLDATDEEIMEACRAVDLHDKFLSFTDGYDTLVGERGVRLSGGELQRVAIAQAIIKNPKVVLLDEATSSVDSETEAKVQDSLKLLTEGRTTLVVAHRLSTIMNADRIIVINDGEIIEQGHHSELMHNKGYYHRLCLRQGFTTDSAGTGHGANQGETADGSTPSIHAKPTNPVCSTNTKKPLADAIISGGGTPIDKSVRSNYTPGKALSNTPRLGLYKPSDSGNSWKPDAPEFIPRASQPPELRQSQLRLSQQGNTNNEILSVQERPGPSTLEYETETDESFNIETGFGGEGVQEGAVKVAFENDHTKIQTHFLRQDAQKGKSVVESDSSVPPVNPSSSRETHSNTTDRAKANDSSVALNETPTTTYCKRTRIDRRNLSKSEPVDRIGRMSGDISRTDSTADSFHEVSFEAPDQPDQRKKQSGAVAKQKRRRRKYNSRGRSGGSNNRSSTDWTRSSSERYQTPTVEPITP